MFGQNEIVGKSFFKEAKEDELLVTSMFFTLQGEGPFRGMPAFFIRLAKCNLACSFCDTYFDAGDWMSFDEISSKIEMILDEYFWKMSMPRPEWAYHHPLDEELPNPYEPGKRMVLVVTGGEPSLQKNLGPFLERMKDQFEHLQIESNGILAIDLPSKTTIVVSPKCVEKNGKAVKYTKPSEYMLQNAECLKFVMEAGDGPYASIPDWAHEWAKKGYDRQIFISPMNVYNRLPKKAKTDRLTNSTTLTQRSEVEEVISFWELGLLDMERNQKNHEYAAMYCIKHGFTFNMQLHLFASLP